MIDADEYERKFLNNLSAVLQASCWFYPSLLPRHTGVPIKSDSFTLMVNGSAELSRACSIPGQSETHSREGRGMVAASCLPVPIPIPIPVPGDVPRGSGAPRHGPDASSRLTAACPSPGGRFSVGSGRRLTKPSGREPLYSLRLPWGPRVHSSHPVTTVESQQSCTSIIIIDVFIYF